MAKTFGACKITSPALDNIPAIIYILYFLQLSVSNTFLEMYKAFDKFGSSINSEHGAAHTHVIAVRCPPFFITIVIIIACTLLIRLDDQLLRFRVCEVIYTRNTAYPGIDFSHISM